MDSKRAMNAVSKILTDDPPNNASVTVDWDEPQTDGVRQNFLIGSRRTINDASQLFYDRPAMAMGEGGTIPFMAMLGEQFPSAQFVITGVLGPESNAHGPNEFLHIPFAKRVPALLTF